MKQPSHRVPTPPAASRDTATKGRPMQPASPRTLDCPCAPAPLEPTR